MQHEWFAVRAIQCINYLRIPFCSQCGDNQRLSFATREERRTMRTRQYAGTYSDRTHGPGIPAVNASLSRKNPAADDFLSSIFQCFQDTSASGQLGVPQRAENRYCFCFYLIDTTVAFHLSGMVYAWLSTSLRHCFRQHW